MPATHTADFQTAAVKATNLDAVEKINVGIETDKVRKHLNIVAATPEIRIQDKTGSAPEVNATTMAIVADGGATHFRAGTTTFAEGAETKGNVKFQSSTGATTHAEIVGSSGKLELQDGGLGLKRGSNVTASGTSSVIQEITGPHARESAVLKKYPEVDMTSSVKSGYVIEASSEHSSGTYPGWNAFNGVVETTNGADGEWISGAGKYNTSATNGAYLAHSSNAVLFQGARGEYLGIVLPRRIKVKYVSVYGRPDSGSPRTVREYRLWGSNDGSTWNQLQTGTNTLAVLASTNKFNITVDATTAYSRYRLQALSMNTGEGGVSIGELEYYGTEDVGAGDDSVDTTVKSVYNAPDLTSAALYIDATKPDSNESVTDQSGSGVTVTAVGVTHDSTENAWELTGAATSNIVSGNLASLVGDHPHSVSAWVKADQLNGSGLFHVGTAEGEGDAASRVGFVDDSHISYGGADHFFSNAEWHNVTYTYNGEGSDKKLYLDGRLVNTAKNEDTFGEYPPFAMSDYSQYGYTVSASSSHSNYPSHYAFNDNNTHGTSVNIWITGNGKYNASGVGTPTGSAGTTVVDGTNQVGEWLQIEFPHQLKVSYMDIAPHGQNAGTLDRAPKDGIIAGSRDGSTWETMKSWTGVTDWALDGTSGVYKTFVIDTNTRKAYKYIRIIITKTGGTDAYGALSEVKIFGHRENDLVRFPDSVNVLKYPHVAMTGPAQRGYVVTNASNTHTGGTSIGYSNTDGYKVFNNDVSSYYFGLYDSGTTSPYVTTTGYWDTANYPDLKLSSSSGTPAGDWVSIEMPRKLTLQSVEIASADRILTYSIGESARDFEIWATNDNSSWTRIHQTIDATAPTARGEIRSFDVNASVAYKRFALIVTRNGSTYTGATGRPVIVLGLFNLYGTEPEDVVTRVGDGFDGKVRNLRVFSTALSDARVQEIFDADKDEFGLAKSSVSVYRGHLGVGTTEPKAALTVMDEVAELEEFPPRGFSTVGVSVTTLYVQQHIEGHGVFRASASSQHGSAGRVPGAFDKQTDTYWHAANGGDYNYNGTDYSYGSGPDSLAGIGGAWLRLELPYKVKLSAIGIRARSGQINHSPEDFTILGNNDNGIWTIIQSFTGKSWSDIRSTTIPITTGPVAYNSFAIITTRTVGAQGHTIGELRYFGTREQGASTLHNGELSLTRNLTVPRIGPALDADDTPRRDRLVVEYNTSTNPTENGVVNDTSGRGLDGLLDNTYGGAAYNPYYDANEKALVFDGSNDYVFQNDVHLKTGVGGVYSASVWVRNRATSGTQTVYSLGTYAQLTTSTLYVLDTTLQVVFYNSDLSVTYTIPKNTWTHIVVTHAGGPTSTTTKMYINGVDVGLAAVSGTSYPLSTVNFPSPCNLFLGKNSDNSVYGGPMDLSNFKLYDVALTADEVKRLYNMGWCDEGHHVVNFSKTRVGIGLGDGEAPQAALDVRDLSEIKQLGVGMNGTGTHRPSIAPLSVCKDTFDELGGGIELMRTNTPEGNSGLGFNRGSAIWHAHKSSTNRETLYFAIGGGNYGTSSYDYNRVRGYFDTNNGGGNITFTGQHRAVVEGTPLHETEKYQGLIVSAKNNKYVKLNNGIETGSSAITINESVPLVSLSSVAQDKSCFGVISDSEDPDVREDRIGNFVTTGQKEKGDHRWFINSVGEGAIWVADINGPLESGDYITTSNIAGYGQKQDGAGLMNYTVAKITMDCDFEPATQPIQRIKQSNVVETHYTGLVQVAKSVPHEFVTTVVSADDAWSNVSISPSDVTYAEWSNLESNVQNTYTLEYTSTSNVVYDVKYTKTTTANVTAEDAWDAVHVDPPEVTYAEYSNLEANVQNTYSLTFTRTTTEEKTPSEWSALDANAQALWSVRYYDTVEQNVDADYPGAVAHDTVTDKLENDLDEHGQIQWEDTEETEKAYKIRYLDASGQQTDEANAVHRAAFVGCTYHCG